VANEIDKNIAKKDELAQRKLSVAALFKQSGGIAAVDMRRFGTRAGEIIARGARAPRRPQRLRKTARFRPLRAAG
jgi:hypothetical protein